MKGKYILLFGLGTGGNGSRLDQVVGRDGVEAESVGRGNWNWENLGSSVKTSRNL